ncbi:fluoride efflux transporter FluC [Brockia lithotrophica]|uniref:Fluoride-specific ion channel FluC n=1 Tax=Brockia lithotrophica TaxID=933949 RepID=A0A660L546_9BACL|nr:CrcB family protein [Brockia lithotrophica]RKQ88538.1 camphor resistance protein CrcB [Brockia lithotrophica]
MAGFLVFAGGFFGAILRYLLSAPLNTRAFASGAALPWGTLAVNLSGAFTFGLLDAVLPLPSPFRPLLLAGFLGGYTTFSALMLEIDDRWQNRRPAAILYAGISFLGGPIFVYFGYLLTGK